MSLVCIAIGAAIVWGGWVLFKPGGAGRRFVGRFL
jgi:ammonia channel protein AmtB